MEAHFPPPILSHQSASRKEIALFFFFKGHLFCGEKKALLILGRLLQLWTGSLQGRGNFDLNFEKLCSFSYLCILREEES